MGGVHAAAARASGTTLERVVGAWSSAEATTRRATVAAAVTGVVAATAAPSTPPARVALALTGALLTLAALVDVHEHRLPNRLLAVGFVVAAVTALLATDTASIAHAFLGGLAAGTAMLMVRLTRGVGMGDVKMAAVVGTSVGAVWLPGAPLAIALAAAAAAGYGVVAHRPRLPLGPALWFGWVATVAGAGWSA